jgi:asparagine synthetase B (glutamine-hydrolysing)
MNRFDLIQLRTRIQASVLDAVTPETGVLLSGGIDSSTIASFVPGLPMFTGWYQGEPYDERQWARLAAGSNHHEIEITPQDFVECFDEMIDRIEPPFAGPGTFGQFMVAWYARDHVARLLSGEGGDELFGGYARLLIIAGEERPDGYEGYRPPKDYPKTLEKALAYDWERLPELLRVDEMVTQAHGLEAVAPMLDSRVVDWVLARPAGERVGKKLLRSAMTGFVPREILERRDKRGFPVPYVEWAQLEPVRSFVGDRIGYLPDPGKPWDRKWWLDLCEASKKLVAA